MAVSPQCPAGRYWTELVEPLEALAEHALATLPVDPDRFYLTGISMGGFGTWHLAVRRPDLVAAAVPVCGGGQRSAGFPAMVAALRDVPVWAFHGALDRVVPARESQVLVDELRRRGGIVRFTLYPDLAHDSWTRTYADPELYAWMLQQRRAGRD